MTNAEVLETGKRLQPSRRTVLQGTAAVAAAALLRPATAAAEPHDAEGSRYSGDQPVASIRKNIVETESGRISGYESGGIITFKGIPYAATTEGANRFMPRPRRRLGLAFALRCTGDG